MFASRFGVHFRDGRGFRPIAGFQEVLGTLLDNGLGQWSPTFLAPGTGAMEDNFSTDQGGRMVWG